MATKKIKIHAGQDNELLFPSYADTAKTIPFDFTGYTFVAEIKKKTTDTLPVASFVASTKEGAFSGVQNVISLFLSEENSKILNNLKNLVWDMLAIPPLGKSYFVIDLSDVEIINFVSER